MGTDLVTVLVILGVALALFVSDRVRLDLVGLLVVVALGLTGVLTPQEALAGFADPLVVMIAALFVVSAAMTETGLAGGVGEWIARTAGTGERRLMTVLMLATAGLSAFMSSTGTVAIMVPIAMRLAWRNGFSPSVLLAPVAFAALMGGTLTVIATPPNLVASQTLAEAGYGSLGFFALAPVGLAMLAVTVLFMATLGRRLLPARAPTRPDADDAPGTDIKDFADRYGFAEEMRRFTVPPSPDLAGKTLAELRWPELLGVRVVAIEFQPDRRPLQFGPRRRPAATAKRLLPTTALEPGDRVLVQGPEAGLTQLGAAHGLSLAPVDPSTERIAPSNLVFAELLVTPRSSWQDRTISELRFRDRYRAIVLAIKRGGERLTGGLAEERLRVGDVILVRGFPEAMALMRRERQDAVMLSEATDGEPPAPRAARAPVAAVIIVAMLAAMALSPLPLVTTVLLAVIALVATGSITPEAAYRSVQWPSIVLIAAMLPLATALSRTGGVELAADGLVALLGDAGPSALLAGVYLATVLVTQFLTNTTSAVLMAPVALQAATSLGVAPTPLLVAVALGASCTLINPVSSPVTTLVLSPGQYRFSDLPRAGVPLQLLLAGVVILLVPVVFPL